MNEVMSIAGTALANTSKNTMIQMSMSGGYAALAFIGGAIAFSGAAVAIYAIAAKAARTPDTLGSENFMLNEQ